MYIDFVVEYWYLFAMLAVIIIMLTIDPAARGAAGAKSLSPLQLPQIQARENALVVDVNETDAFKTGHISQALNLPMSKFEDSLGKLKKKHDRAIIITCETGAKSSKAATILKKNEFTNLYILTGGLAAWKKENLPLEKGKS